MSSLPIFDPKVRDEAAKRRDLYLTRLREIPESSTEGLESRIPAALDWVLSLSRQGQAPAGDTTPSVEPAVLKDDRTTSGDHEALGAAIAVIQVLSEKIAHLSDELAFLRHCADSTLQSECDFALKMTRAEARLQESEEMQRLIKHDFFRVNDRIKQLEHAVQEREEFRETLEKLETLLISSQKPGPPPENP